MSPRVHACPLPHTIARDDSQPSCSLVLFATAVTAACDDICHRKTHLTMRCSVSHVSILLDFSISVAIANSQRSPATS